jgi:hypothetical protein
MKKVCAILFAAVAMATLGLQGTASATTAGWPTGCSYGKYDIDGAWAECSKSNGGVYRAVVICKPLDGGLNINKEASVWKTSGVSLVFCPPMSVYQVAGITSKASR